MLLDKKYYNSLSSSASEAGAIIADDANSQMPEEAQRQRLTTAGRRNERSGDGRRWQRSCGDPRRRAAAARARASNAGMRRT